MDENEVEEALADLENRWRIHEEKLGFFDRATYDSDVRTMVLSKVVAELLRHHPISLDAIREQLRQLDDAARSAFAVSVLDALLDESNR